jgi:hypothetical protein
MDFRFPGNFDQPSSEPIIGKSSAAEFVVLL